MQVIDFVFVWMIQSSQTLWVTLQNLIIPILFFSGISFLIKRGKCIVDAQKSLGETQTTFILLGINVIFILPILMMFSAWAGDFFDKLGIVSFGESVWGSLPMILVAFAAIFAGDFVGYWRHRLEHSKLLWPSHAVHHSDTQMTWLTLERFHPINRLTTFLIDNTILLLLGFPPYALMANYLVRHYYGFFIHADLPWTYGRFGALFVSPAMHRWHHAAEPAAYNSNYATVFSVFDRWFGTFRVPGPCGAPLGVEDDMGVGVAGQIAYPFKARSYRPGTGQPHQVSSG